ncbi:MAG: hypothetical protein J6R08_00260 [Opitutales bacterium]|nr:hypothetical protein [Opitutales bacterium]
MNSPQKKWSVKINGSPFQIADLKLKSAILNLRTLASDRFKISSPKKFPFSEGDRLSLFFNGACRFAGFCGSLKTSITAQRKTYEAVFKNAWAELEKIPYTQDWQALLDESQSVSTQKISRIILGQSANGEKISAGEQIADIIACANSKGAGISIGEIGISAQIPADEASDMSCAQAILRVLKWMPDIATEFDYSDENAAVLNFKKRSECETISIENNAVKSISFEKRNDLKVQNVCINYEKTNTVNGANFKAVSRDVYPPNSEIGCKNSLMLTVPLGGYSQKTQHQKVETADISISSESWWKSKVPFLSNPKISHFNLKNIKRKSTLPRELLSGSVMEWMLCALERDTISADVEYYIDGALAGKESVSLKLLATNARSTTYSRTVAATKQEPQPSGLAQAIFEATEETQTEGECSIANAQNLNLFLKNILYKNELENACATETSLDIFKGELKAKFGPPKHLYPADIAELFRTASTRRTAQNPQIRLTGETSKDNSFQYSDSVYTPVIAGFPQDSYKISIANPEDGSEIVAIDPNDIAESDEVTGISLKKLMIVSNGNPSHAYFLMSNAL